MTARALERPQTEVPHPVDSARIDWERAAYTVLVSRALDELEESRLLPERKVLYQFTARGHDVTQALLGQMLTGARDGVGVYYRSRPLMLALGLTVEDALASTMMRLPSRENGNRSMRPAAKGSTRVSAPTAASLAPSRSLRE